METRRRTAFALDHRTPVAKGARNVLPKGSVFTLAGWPQPPRRVLVFFGDIEGAERSIPNTGDRCQVCVPMVLKVTMVSVMHHGAVQPFREPTRVVKSHVIMTKGAIEAEEQRKKANIEQRGLRNPVTE